MRTHLLLLTLMVLAFPAPAFAQAERYELGQRLKRFETAWEKQTDAAIRKRALAIVEKVTRQFLSFQLGEAGRTLDEAWWELSSRKELDSPTWWGLAIYADPERRAVDAKQESVKVTLRKLYTVKVDASTKATATLRIGHGSHVSVPLDKLPVTVEVPCRTDNHNGYFKLYLSVAVEGARELPVTEVGFSTVQDSKLHLDAVTKGKAECPPIEAATLTDRLDLLNGLFAGTEVELDYPVADLLGMARTMVQTKKPFYTHDRGGQFWLTVPTGKNSRTPCRIFVPDKLDPKKPVPIVVALHGAGGSENLFFEGYGNGQIVKECEKRGWLLLTTRSGLGFLGGPPPILDIVTALAERYPIDTKRIFLVGHSMGASQAVEAIQKSPGNFAAAALLGGTGRVRKGEAFAELPLLVGVGTKDFALGGARSLHKALVAGGAMQATLKEYPDLEHLLIVRESYPDVFALFDKAAKN